MKLYIKKGCSHCENVLIPEGLKLETIDVDDETYTGFKPGNIPVLQFNSTFNAEGDFFINEVLKVVKEAQDGIYKQ